MTESEIVSIITQLKNISGSDYDANKRMLDLICNGFTFRRDIPKLFKYNAFVVISDGVNNKIGSLFSPYEYFYAWRKVEYFLPYDIQAESYFSMFPSRIQ